MVSSYAKIYACLYVCVERTHEKKMNTLGEKTHRAEKIASIHDKKPHVYRVIILEQMADHTFVRSLARVILSSQVLDLLFLYFLIFLSSRVFKVSEFTNSLVSASRVPELTNS
mgnify:CR=1 FL=1